MRQASSPAAVDPSDERMLIEAVRAGDQSAFKDLYRQHLGRVYALCLRLCGDAQIAEDVSQEVFIKVWRKISDFRMESRFSTWIHRISVTTAISHMRARKSWVERVTLKEEPIETESFSEEMDLTDLDGMIKHLPARTRIVFVLHALEGLRHKEIADQLNIAESSSKTHYHRAKIYLQERLSQ